MSTLAPFHALFTPQGLSTGVGFAASSFFFWGNLALARMGAIHLIKPTSARRLRITPVQALALWETNLDLATYVTVIHGYIARTLTVKLAHTSSQPTSWPR
jgi:hypothetical protein